MYGVLVLAGTPYLLVGEGERAACGISMASWTKLMWRCPARPPRGPGQASRRKPFASELMEGRGQSDPDGHTKHPPLPLCFRNINQPL